MMTLVCVMSELTTSTRTKRKKNVMSTNKKNTTVKDSLVEDLGESESDNSLGRPESPTLPLVGSENVPVTPKEEELYRV